MTPASKAELPGFGALDVRFRLPWQPGRVTCALSIDLRGRRLLQKRLEGLTPLGHRVVYDATVAVSGGVAVFKRQTLEDLATGQI